MGETTSAATLRRKVNMLQGEEPGNASARMLGTAGALSSLQLTRVPGNGEPLKSFLLESVSALSVTGSRTIFQGHRGQILPLDTVGNRQIQRNVIRVL